MFSRLLSLFGFAALFATTAACSTTQVRPESATRPAVECRGATVRGARDAARFFACESIVGDLTIRGTELTSLSDFARVRSISGSLVIADNRKLGGVEALARLDSVVAVEITNNPELQSLHGLERLAQLERLVLRRTGLFGTGGLEGLRGVGDLVIEKNPRLLSLAGLKHLGRARSLAIRNNPRLAASFGLLPELAGVEGEVSVEGNLGFSRADEARLASQAGEGGVKLASER
jgi:hypothetical protein